MVKAILRLVGKVYRFIITYLFFDNAIYRLYAVVNLASALSVGNRIKQLPTFI